MTSAEFLKTLKGEQLAYAENLISQVASHGDYTVTLADAKKAEVDKLAKEKEDALAANDAEAKKQQEDAAAAVAALQEQHAAALAAKEQEKADAVAAEQAKAAEADAAHAAELAAMDAEKAALDAKIAEQVAYVEAVSTLPEAKAMAEAAEKQRRFDELTKQIADAEAAKEELAKLGV